MVVRLEGKIDGKEVIFNWIGRDRWQAIIPANLNGIYIVDMTAYDEAGNIGYCAKCIITVDVSALCVHIEKYPFFAEIINEYEIKEYTSPYYAGYENEYHADISVCNYYAEIMKPECGG